MLEAELKAALSPEQAASLPETLAALGFSEQRAVWETDVYFHAPERDLRQTDEALRLRMVRPWPDGPEQSCITYKGPKLDAVSSTRRELETTLGDADVMRALLEALGYRAVPPVSKLRRSFTRGTQTVCLDTVDGLGPYLELETILPDGADGSAATAQLLSLLDTLGVARRALTRDSYLDLLMTDRC